MLHCTFNSVPLLAPVKKILKEPVKPLTYGLRNLFKALTVLKQSPLITPYLISLNISLTLISIFSDFSIVFCVNTHGDENTGDFGVTAPELRDYLKPLQNWKGQVYIVFAQCYGNQFAKTFSNHIEKTPPTWNVIGLKAEPTVKQAKAYNY